MLLLEGIDLPWLRRVDAVKSYLGKKVGVKSDWQLVKLTNFDKVLGDRGCPSSNDFGEEFPGSAIDGRLRVGRVWVDAWLGAK